MANKSSLDVIKTFAQEKSQKQKLNTSFSEMFYWVKQTGYTEDTFELVPLRAEKSRHSNACDKSVQLDLLSWK